MAYNFKFPDVGEGITEGELVEWKVKVGDVVKEDQVLADVETDKAVVQIPSPVGGTILELRAQQGTTIHVGDVFVVIGEKGEKPQENLEEKVTPTKETTKKKGSVGVVGELEDADTVIETPVQEARKTLIPIKPKVETAVKQADAAVGKALAMPGVKKLAKELGIDLATTKATGAHGQVTDSDVRSVQGKGTSPIAKEVKHVRKYDMYGYVSRVPLKGVRKAIAKNMVISATTIPHVSHIDKVDMTKLVAIRQAEKLHAEKKGIKLTYLPFIIKALIAALQDHPSLNASLETSELGDEIVLKKYYNIGVAVDTPDGLMVPVIKGADHKSILDLAKEIVDLATNAQKRSINLGDLKGGTFTVTNYGSIGGMYGTPIINYPEAAILGIGRMKDEAIVDDKGKASMRKVMYLTLSFDHRILDGAEAARFMNKVISYLEDPDLLLVDM